MDKYLRDYDTLYQRTQKLTEDLEEQITKNQQQHLEGVQQQKTIKQTNEAVIRLDLEKKQAVRKADREHRTMLQYKTLLAESKTPLLLAQKEIASLQKELDAFRKAVDAKAKERDAMEREAKFAKAETEKVLERRPVSTTFVRFRDDGVPSTSTPSPRHRQRVYVPRETAERLETAQNRPRDHPRPPFPETGRVAGVTAPQSLL